MSAARRAVREPGHAANGEGVNEREMHENSSWEF